MHPGSSWLVVGDLQKGGIKLGHGLKKLVVDFVCKF